KLNMHSRDIRVLLALLVGPFAVATACGSERQFGSRGAGGAGDAGDSGSSNHAGKGGSKPAGGSGGANSSDAGDAGTGATSGEFAPPEPPAGFEPPLPAWFELPLSPASPAPPAPREPNCRSLPHAVATANGPTKSAKSTRMSRECMFNLPRSVNQKAPTKPTELK